MKSALLHSIYVQPLFGGQCSVATCWGDPEQFLRDLGRSGFVHLVDQYVGLFSANRYGVGFDAAVSYAHPAGPLLDADIQAIVHAAAAQAGASGYGHIYNVFLPPGQDECIDSTLGECYSPDNPATFYFCAYHSSVDFPDIGHVLYTVQPDMNIMDCEVQPGTANGMLVDSTNNALSHEVFETITDPDGNAWVNSKSLLYSGAEIGDECVSWLYDAAQDFYYHYATEFLVGTRHYAVQLVYSNEQHACSSAP